MIIKGEKIIDVDDYAVIKKTDGENLLRFNIDVNNEGYILLKEQDTINADGQDYIIRSIDMDLSTAKVECVIDTSELKSTPIRNFTTGTANTLEQLFQEILPQGWSLQLYNYSSKRRLVKCDGVKSPHGIIQAAHDFFDFAIQYDNSKERIVGNEAEIAISEDEDPIVIYRQPQDVTAEYDTNIQISVSAGSTTAQELTYRWYASTDGGNTWIASGLSGAHTDTLSLSATQSRNGYRFRCRINDGTNTVITREIKLKTVSVGTVPILICRQPGEVLAHEDDNVVLKIETVNNTGRTIKFQWQASTDGGTNWSDSSLSGNKTDTLTVKLTQARNGYRFRCVITDSRCKAIVYQNPTSYNTDPVMVMDGLNLDRLEYKGKTDGFFTVLYAEGKEGLTFSDINDGKDYVTDFSYCNKEIIAYWKDERYTDKQSLLEDATAKVHKAAYPDITYTCSIRDLYAANKESYPELKLDLLSTVRIIDYVKDTTVNMLVSEYETHPLSPEKNIVTLSSTLEAVKGITETINNAVAEEATTRKTEVELAFEKMQEIIDNSSGLYCTKVTDTGGASIYYLHDQPALTDSTIIWRMAADIVSVSTDGGVTWNAGITASGEVIANRLSVVGIDAEWIRIGKIAENQLNTSVKNKINSNIVSVTVQYAQNQSQTTAPTSGWQDNAPQWQEGYYIWQRTKCIEADDTITYSTALCITGVKGTDGTDGTSVTITSIEYGISQSASTQPASWQSSVPSVNQGEWLWCRTTFSDSSINYSKSYQGTDGDDGISVQVQSATKSGGVTTVIIADSEGNTTTLTINDGEDGDNGTPGANGYVHTAWANSADGSVDFSTSVSAGKKYLGVYSDNTQADSQTYSDYSWSLIKGADGADGEDGVGIASIEEEWYLSTSDSSQTGGSWSSTQPAYTSGKYYWFRSKVTYDDGSIVYSTPILANGVNNANSTATAAETTANAASTAAAAATGISTTVRDKLIALCTDNNMTSINGGLIAAATILANSIDLNNLFAQNITASNFNLTGGSINIITSSSTTDFIKLKYGDKYVYISPSYIRVRNQQYSQTEEGQTLTVDRYTYIDDEGLIIRNGVNILRTVLAAYGLDLYDKSGNFAARYGNNALWHKNSSNNEILRLSSSVGLLLKNSSGDTVAAYTPNYLFYKNSSGKVLSRFETYYLSFRDGTADKWLSYLGTDGLWFQDSSERGLASYLSTGITIYKTGDPKYKVTNDGRVEHLGGTYPHIMGNGTWLHLSFTSANANSGVDIGVGVFRPETDQDLDLGASSKRWKQIYSTNSTISTSDKREKHDINKISEDYLRLFDLLEPVSYMRNGGDRIHLGFVSQDVENALEQIGMSATDFAGFCKDVMMQDGNPETKEEVPVLDEKGIPEYRYSLRYEEFIALNAAKIKAMDRYIKTLEGRIAALESKIIQ